MYWVCLVHGGDGAADLCAVGLRVDQAYLPLRRRRRSAVRAILRDMKVDDYDPEVESMLLDFASGFVNKLANRSAVLRKHVGSSVVTEGVATAACAVVENETFEPPLSLEDMLSEAAMINGEPLPLTASPALELPPLNERLTAANFEVELAEPALSASAEPLVASSLGRAINSHSLGGAGPSPAVLPPIPTGSELIPAMPPMPAMPPVPAPPVPVGPPPSASAAPALPPASDPIAADTSSSSSSSSPSSSSSSSSAAADPVVAAPVAAPAAAPAVHLEPVSGFPAGTIMQPAAGPPPSS